MVPFAQFQAILHGSPQVIVHSQLPFLLAVFHTQKHSEKKCTCVISKRAISSEKHLLSQIKEFNGPYLLSHKCRFGRPFLCAALQPKLWRASEEGFPQINFEIFRVIVRTHAHTPFKRCAPTRTTITPAECRPLTRK